MSHEKQCEPSSEGDHVSFLFSLPAVGRAGPLNEAGGLPDEPWPVWLLGSKLILEPDVPLWLQCLCGTLRLCGKAARHCAFVARQCDSLCGLQLMLARVACIGAALPCEPARPCCLLSA